VGFVPCWILRRECHRYSFFVVAFLWWSCVVNMAGFVEEFKGDKIV
jgi:hypothetical protein